MSDLKSVAITCKQQLISRDISAIDCINEHLQNSNDDSFVRIVLGLEIPHFLLTLLTSLHYDFSLHILKCLEQLCSYRVFYLSDYPVKTADTILKTLVYLETKHDYDDVLIESLNIITIIIENLDDTYVKKSLIFFRYLNIAKSLLFNKQDPLVILKTIKMLSALMLLSDFQKQMNNNMLTLIESIWQLSLNKLSEIYNSDMKKCLIGVSTLCDSTLRMLGNILMYKQEKIVEFYSIVQSNSLNCLKFVCIPYIEEFGLKSDEIYTEYLCFLKSLLLSNLHRDTLIDICERLITNSNFTVIVRYFGRSNSILDKEEQENIRELCLMILCEIIGNRNNANTLAQNNVMKKYFFKKLHAIVRIDINEWLISLRESSITFDTQLVIIKFCTVYYIEANNINELKIVHLNSLIDFLKNHSHSENSIISKDYLKDVWLLFAICCCYYSEELCENYSLCKAVVVLQKLLFLHKESMHEMVTFHPGIICWVFLVPSLQKEFISIVVKIFIVHSESSFNARLALLYAVANIKGAASFLLDVLQYWSPPLSSTVAELLYAAITESSLAQNSEFSVQILLASVTFLTNFVKGPISKENVVPTVYVFYLAVLVDVPPNKHLLNFSVRNIVSCLGSLSILDTLPLNFYTNVINYLYNILQVSKNNQFDEVVLNIINCGSFICTLLSSFLTDHKDLPISAAKLCYNLLEYQTKHRLYCRDSIIIKKEIIVKLLHSKNEELLQLHLQILRILFTKTTKSILDVQKDKSILQGVYLRCQNLVSMPTDSKIGGYGLQCMESLLRYTYINNTECWEYLSHHSGNHLMIWMCYEKETKRPCDRAFLSFINYWLQYASKNKENLYNRQSITLSLWKMSLFRITKMIQGEDSKTISDNIDIVNNIFKQLFQLIDLLPVEQVNYLRTVEEKLISC